MIDLQLSPHRYPGCPLFLFLYGKRTIVKLIRIVNLLHEEGKLFGLRVDYPFLLFGAAIEEDVFLTGMAVDIDVHDNFFLFVHPTYHISEVVDFWRVCLPTVSPFAVQIETRSRKPIIAVDDSIRIDHGYHFEQVSRSQSFAVLVIGGEFLQEAFHDEGGDSFSGMDAGGEDDHLVALFVADGQEGDVSSVVGFSQTFAVDLVLEVGDEMM